jgi:hypothetical protein
MNSRVLVVFWALVAVGAVIFGLQALSPENPWIIPSLVVMWTVTLIGLLPSRFKKVIGAPVRWLRQHPILYWFLILVYIYVTLSRWVSQYQPTNGRPLLPVEFCYVLTIFWVFIYLLAYDADTPQIRAMGAKLGKSRLSGVLVMLTTILLIAIAAETWMRIYYITTDGYGFTAMNYWWYKNFGWGHDNSLGYRDYEPKPDAPGLTRIAIVGDSFAMGHGINNIDDTFPQILERELGDSYDVNLIAQSGWDTDVEQGHLDAYPLRPNIVVLSYYLNDIDYMLQTPELNPDAIFDFPQDPTLYWFVLNFFVPNYVYYNVAQFTSPLKRENFTMRLIDAHMDDNLWNQQRDRLNQFVDWTVDHDARLIVLLWPQIAAVEDSAPAVARVKDFFESRDIQVVNMSDVLRDKNPYDMIVNRFDSHPGIPAQRLAAEQLYQAITSEPAP